MQFNHEPIYNVHEHNHAEASVWPTERLEERIANIQTRMAQIAYTGARLADIERELDVLSYELTSRYLETKLSEEDEAWLGRNDIIKRLNET